jgi:prepilin-type processing-associated H-X9-DG protein
MQDLAFAVKHYQSRNESLPRDFQTDSGKLLSWRLLLLPDLNEKDLIEKFGLNTKWDGRITNKLRDEESFAIKCPVWAYNSTANKESSYFAITGDETYWMSESSPYKQIQPDYDCDIVMLIEANPSRGEWFEPHDLTMTEAEELLTSVHNPRSPDGHEVNEMSPWISFFYKPSISRNVAMADGSVRTLYTPLPKKLARAILTRHQDEMDRQELDRYSRPQIAFHKLLAFVSLVVLISLPVACSPKAVPCDMRVIAARGGEETLDVNEGKTATQS